jgi:hypothetical protein
MDVYVDGVQSTNVNLEANPQTDVTIIGDPQTSVDVAEEEKIGIEVEQEEPVDVEIDGQIYEVGNPIPGQDGFSPIVEVEEIEGGHRVTVTDAEGTKVFEVMNGQDGEDGYTPQKDVDYFDGKDGQDGRDGVDGYTPVKGVDYFTDSDKKEIAQEISSTYDIDGNGQVDKADDSDKLGGQLPSYYATKEQLKSKADLIDGKVPKEQLPDDIGTGGGGLTKVYWKDIKDKPFEDNRIISRYSQVENPNPVSFDISLLGARAYKVSDLTLTREEIFNGLKFTSNRLSAYYPFNESNIQLETEGLIYVIEYGIDLIFVNKSGTLNFTFSGYPMTLEIPETGIYYVRNVSAGIPEGITIEFVIGEIKQIDLKYIPNNVIELSYEELSVVEDDYDINYTLPPEKHKEIMMKTYNNDVFSILIISRISNFRPIFTHTGGGCFHTMHFNTMYTLDFHSNGIGCKSISLDTNTATPFSLRRTPPLEELMTMGEESMIERGLV